MSKTCNKMHAARAVRLFYSFNQSYRSDLALLLLSSILKQRLHERCFIWNRIVFDAVTPSVYTTPIETVAETGSIWKRCQKWSVFKTIRIYLTCKQRNRIDLSTVTIIVRNLHSSIQNGESRMCHHITSYLLFFSEAIQNITIFNISSGSIPNQHPKTFYWLWIH